jgi:hypothetical protein
VGKGAFSDADRVGKIAPGAVAQRCQAVPRDFAHPTEFVMQ